MRFSLNMFNIIPEMGNEYDEQIRDIDPDYELTREIIKMILRGEIELEVVREWTGTFLEIEVPDELLEKYGYFDEELDENQRPLDEFLEARG